MHMVVGFVLASLLRKKKTISSALPSIFGTFEVVHAIPGRIRFTASVLENRDAGLLDRIEKELSKVEGIASVRGNSKSGSLVVNYDHTKIEESVVHGVAVKVLGLEKALEEMHESALLKELKLVGRSIDRQIYQSSGGLLDLKSSLLAALVAFGLYRMVIMQERTLPSGINLLWWAYILSKG